MGEGGGQMVRSAMALAVATGNSLRMDNVRAKRRKPGLMRQHLTSVRAAAAISDGELTGAHPGSSALTFVPHEVPGGEYEFCVGTAGSAMLVLQTVLPPLLNAAAPTTIILEGGTHNQWAPPFEFLQRAYLPLINRMGPTVTMRLEKHGFYPAGGGRIVVDVVPATSLTGFDLLDAGRVVSRRIRALVSNLPVEIGEREVSRVARKLNWQTANSEVLSVRSNGPGNVVLAEIEYENLTEVFTGFGRTGVRAEKVADEVVRSVRSHVKAQVPVGVYLADQLLLPLSLSASQPGQACPQHGGTFRTGKLSSHAVTHIEVLKRFLEIDIRTDSESDGTTVSVAAGCHLAAS